MSKYPTSSGSRQTPPFFEFESVKQSLRISLPNTDPNNQLGIFNNSNLMNHNDTTSRSSNISIMDKQKNKKKSKIDNQKGQKQKDKGAPIKQQYDQRLDSQFTFKRVSKTQRFTEHNTQRNAQRHTEQNKKSVKKSNGCKKSSKKGEKSKSKAKQKLDLTHQLKCLNIKLKNNTLNTPLNLTQNWNRHSLDLKQVHTIYTSRTTNNRSHNLNSKDKKNVEHKRGMSQQLINNKKNKSVSQNLSKGKDQESCDPLNALKFDSKNWDMKRKIYSNSSLSSFDYCQFSPKFENEFTQQFSKQFSAFPNSEQTQRFDSEDEQLLTMVSQDTQRIQNRMINKKQITERSSRNKKGKQPDADKISTNTDRKQWAPVDSDFKKKPIKFDSGEQVDVDKAEDKPKDLMSVIDTTLIKLTTLYTNENDKDQKIQKHGAKQKEQRVQREDNIKIEQDTDNRINKNHKQKAIQTEHKSLMSFKWKQEPILYKLQQILDQKLTENLQSKVQNVVTQPAGRILKRNNQNEKFIKMKKSLDVEEKWKEDEIKRIEKAKRLLMMGLFQADKLLGDMKSKGIGNFSSESTKLLFKKTEKQLNLSKNSLKRKCKSLLNLHKQFSLSSLKVPKTPTKKQKKTKLQKILSPQQFLNKPLNIAEPNESESSQSIIDDTFIEPNLQDSIQSKLPNYETDFNINFSKIVLNPPKSNFNSPIEYKNQPSEESDYEILFEQSKINKEASEVIREFKDISNGEAEQIFEFMFIDLLLDLIEEIEINFSKPSQLFSSLKCNKTSLLQKSATQIGFITGPKQIVTLLQKFSKFLQQTQDKQTSKTYKQLIFQRVQEPIGPKATELLRYMRQDQDQDFEMDQDEASDYEQKSSFALNIGWFQEFSKAQVEVFDFGVYYPQDKQKQTKRVSFLKSAMHIHTKAVFDSINETIDKYRPYGLIGQPFPWKPHLRPAPINKQLYHKILNKTFEEVVDSCRFLCGIFIEQHLSYKLSGKEYEEIAEDRLNKLLRKDVEQSEGRWSFTDDQETQILVDTAKYVSKQLALEFSQELQEIMKKRNQS